MKLKLIGLASLSLFLVACGQSSNADGQVIRLASSPGPYSEFFLDYIAPELENQGYQVKNITFTDLRAADVGMAEGEADLNVDQHSLYLDNFNQESQANLQKLGPIPTVPTAIYPANKADLAGLADGDRIGIPDDPSNLTRALLLLEKAGIISIKTGANLAQLSLEDVEAVGAQVELLAMQSATIPRTLPDLEFAVIPGSIAYDADLDFNRALAYETVEDKFFLQAVVAPDQVDQDWTHAVMEIYQSPVIKDKVAELNQSSGQAYWVLPEK
ncbi:hypothetical protein AWM75_06310 [Aerococcus urinaehominis]|uniref:Uncharacterized protein n=1 Tax=Aerococcus urinaehominis TaxID=128944 RepID=A0A0X8FLN9_9LACT|nr:MetQ/NlpA family ABC transporter substrate-binding protein [Aerococcus urinaehominis]AMB99618.1 hypothetical protein AWM75_06310 [Aerococcus urinaehominis]SDL87621.1 D-methionine transport system substrate-binding protein [Aerococcus urinaehominis]